MNEETYKQASLWEEDFSETEGCIIDRNSGKYTQLGKSPVYTPSTKKPHILALYDDTKYKRMVRKINESNVTDEEKRFLIAGATRHIRFQYDMIANYYANASGEMQRLMEDSALVILDIEDAIAKGFCKLQDKIEKEYKRQILDEE